MVPVAVPQAGYGAGPGPERPRPEHERCGQAPQEVADKVRRRRDRKRAGTAPRSTVQESMHRLRHPPGLTARPGVRRVHARACTEQSYPRDRCLRLRPGARHYRAREDTRGIPACPASVSDHTGGDMHTTLASHDGAAAAAILSSAPGYRPMPTRFTRRKTRSRSRSSATTATLTAPWPTGTAPSRGRTTSPAPPCGDPDCIRADHVHRQRLRRDTSTTPARRARPSPAPPSQQEHDHELRVLRVAAMLCMHDVLDRRHGHRHGHEVTT